MLLLAGAALTAGCTSIRTTRPDGTVVIHHFGYVREMRPPAEGGVQVRGFSSAGLHIDESVTLGWWSHRAEVVPPDGRLVIRVTDVAQLDAVRELLAELPREFFSTTPPCLIIEPTPP